LKEVLLRALEKVGKEYVHVVLYHVKYRLAKNPLDVLDENPHLFFEAYREIFGDTCLHLLADLMEDVLRNDYGLEIEASEIHSILTSKKLKFTLKK